MHALVGADDPSMRGVDMALWQRHTTGAATVTTLDAGHFMLQTALSDVIRQIVGALAGWRAAERDAIGRADGRTDRPREER